MLHHALPVLRFSKHVAQFVLHGVGERCFEIGEGVKNLVDLDKPTLR